MTDTARSMEAWATLHRAHARVLAELSRRIEREHGVSVLEHGSLYELGAAPGRRLRMAQLAERLGLTPSATTRLVDRLVERGWMERASPSDNRRTVIVSITREGWRSYVRNNRSFAAAVEAALTARLSENEMTQLIDLLGKLCAHRAGPREP
ncbi:MAG: MarR family winged helix-turn-helix transcriptional regulator [Gemmatimonadota bacterium]